MEIGMRIKELRKQLKMNQTDFGKNIGLNQSTIGGYENGFRSVGDASIISICREYGVSEIWLRTGEGEMFATMPPGCISDLAQEYNLDAFDQVLIEEYLKLDPMSRNAIKQYIRNIIASVDEDAAIEREVAAYREELKAEKREATSSASGLTNAEEAKEA